MERCIPFVVDENYHVFNRGIDKRKIFFSKGDWKHFQHLLYIRNSTKNIETRRVKGLELSAIDRGETLVDILAYVLMPNHFHLLLHEKKEGGITQFMRKLLTSYAMYMNIKYDRTGPLMCRPFRSKYIEDDEYFRWLFSYVHLNPVELIEKEWKEKGIKDIQKAKKYLNEYKYSSYQDYFVSSREEALILNKEALPIDISDLETIDTLFE